MFFIFSSNTFNPFKSCVISNGSSITSPATDNIIATSEYGGEVTAAVAKGNVLGCQFHPEKSGNVGLNILKAFCEL